MNKHFKRWFCGAVLLLSQTVDGQVINGTFDVNHPTYGFYCGAPYGWSVSNYTGWGGDIQWENQWNNDGDTWWTDLTGCGSGNGYWIEQNVITDPGEIYTLSFDLGCWNGQYYTTAGANVYVDGAFMGHFEHADFTGNSLNWKTFSFCFKTSFKETTIRFEGDGAASPATPYWCTPISSYVGVIGLDNVSLTKADAQIFRDGYCLPQTLTHNASGGTAYWYKDGAYIGTGNSINATSPGTYRLLYDTPCGEVEDEVTLEDCKDTCTMNADFEYESVIWQNPEILCAGEYIIFTGFSTTGVALQYNWDFGNGQMGWSNNPSYWYMFNTPGVYNVCLTVWLKPDEIIPLCRPYTICKTITVVDCTPESPQQPGTGTQPADPGGEKTGAFVLPYPMLEVFPNPATDLLTITGIQEIDATAQVSLYDIAGQLVYSETVEAGQQQTSFSLKEFPAGVYILRVQGRQLLQEVKVVKE